MKRIVAAALCLCSAAFFLLGCAGSGGEVSDTGVVQIPNPFEEYETIEQAQEAVGFELNAPEEINGCAERVFRVNRECGLLEVIYRDKDGDRAYTIRKAAGDGDISGDYNKYTYSSTVDGIEVKGEGTSACFLAVWVNGGYTYAVSAEKALSCDDMLALAAAVK